MMRDLFNNHHPASRWRSGLLAASLAVAMTTGQAFAAAFVDVPGSYWADRYIDYLSSRQIITGYPDQTFKPNNPVTRAEFAVMLAKSRNLPTAQAAGNFVDVPANHWAAGAIQSVAQQGWIAGYPGGRFMPNQPISMAEMYTIVAKASGQQQVSDTDAQTILAGFQDMGGIPAWAKPSVATAAKAGITVNELSKTELLPNVQATRASVATTLAKLLNQPFRSDTTGIAQGGAQPQPQQQPQAVNITGMLQATATPGEWMVVTDDGKQYYFTNPSSTLSQQSWFRVGNRVQLQGNLDAQASTAQHPVVSLQNLVAAQQPQNQVAITGKLRPSTQAQGAWVVESEEDNHVYRILNPQQFTNLPWFRYGATVSVTGALRPDVQLPQNEGSALVASKIEAAQARQELSVSGTLQPTTEAGGWVLVDQSNNQKYVLLGTNNYTNQTWFKPGTRVNVTGELSDVPTIYMEGPVLQVSTLQPFAGDIAGTQQVNLYFPNLVSMVKQPGSMVGEPLPRVLEGPDLPTKALTALLTGPTAVEQVRGYYQDRDIQQLKVGQVNITGDTATVVLKAPSADFKFRNPLATVQLDEQVTKTLMQFPGIQDVNASIVAPDNKVLWRGQ